MTLTRREFLKGGGAAIAVTTLAQPVTRVELGPAPTDGYGILIDTTRCIGCRACELMCKKVNGLPLTECDGRPGTAAVKKLEAGTWTAVQCTEVVTEENHVLDIYVKRQCMHCLQPACVSACPVGALRKTPDGPVVYDAERCIGCRYCMVACPFDIPRYEWRSATPRISKCQMCYDTRISKGQAPACVGTCPTGALTFGTRSELLAEAHRRIATHPNRYINHVYGESEVGGTSVLYLSAVPFEELGLPGNLPERPLPEYTHDAMSKIPPLILGLIVTLGGVAYLTHHKGAQTKQEG